MCCRWLADHALLLDAHADETRERAVDQGLEGRFGSSKRDLEQEGRCRSVLVLYVLQLLCALEGQDDVLLQVRVEREFSTRTASA